MADADKKYSEDEHLAIVADRVTRETSNLAAEKAALETAKGDLESKLDVEIAAHAAEKARADKAEKDFTDFKAQIERDREAAARKDERLAAVKEAAPHLTDEFFTDESRVTRIVAMEDEAFTAYVADMKAVVPEGTKPAATQEVPRETAMTGADGGGGDGNVSAAAGVLFHGKLRSVSDDTAKGA